jgi:two-component system phosphate regulon response regulator PhoB
VVDDSKAIRDLLSSFLRTEGYRVDLASSGKEALEQARNNNPQIVLLDVKMPGIDGLETCRRLRAEKKTRYIPVIMITGFGANNFEADDVGADDFMDKPFNLKDLAMRLKSAIRIGHLTDRAERVLTYLDELEKNRPEWLVEQGRANRSKPRRFKSRSRSAK